MQTRAFTAGLCSERVVSLMIAHSLEYPKPELNVVLLYITWLFSLASCAKNQYCNTVLYFAQNIR